MSINRRDDGQRSGSALNALRRAIFNECGSLNMGHYIEYIGDESLISKECMDIVRRDLGAVSLERAEDGNYSGLTNEFGIQTLRHERDGRYELNSMISLRLHNNASLRDCKVRSLMLLSSLLKETDCNLEFYSFDKLLCYRKNGGINICLDQELSPNRQFWSPYARELLGMKYNVIVKSWP